MSFHDQLLRATEPERQALLGLPILHQAAQGRVSLDQYRAFLTQAYHHVRHTTPLLMACGARLGAEQEWLRDAVAEYIREELGHQEWVLDDLQATGVDRARAAASKPWLQTELMVAYAYDSIARISPLAFFGMVLVLEGTSIALATRAADQIERQLGLPRSAFSYLRSHGDLDIEHTHFFAGLMDRIEDPADQRVIIHAAKAFYRLYADIFRALQQVDDTIGVAA